MTPRRARTRRRVAGVTALLLLASLSWLLPWLERLEPGARARHRWWVVALEEGKRPRPWSSLFVDARGEPLASPAPAPGPFPLLSPGFGPSARLVGLEGTYDATRMRPPLQRDAARTLRLGDVLTDRGVERPGAAALLLRTVYATGPDVPPDPWGHPWLLAVEYVELRGRHYRANDDLVVHSAGPDGHWGWGTGDDLLVEPLEPSSYLDFSGVLRPTGVPADFDRTWVGWAVALGWCWLAWHAWTATRSPRLGVELVRVALLAGPPALALVMVISELDRVMALDHALGAPGPWSLVSMRDALCTTLTGLLLALALWRRATRPPAP